MVAGEVIRKPKQVKNKPVTGGLNSILTFENSLNRRVYPSEEIWHRAPTDLPVGRKSNGTDGFSRRKKKK